MRVGAAVREVPTGAGMLLAGFAHRPGPSTGVHDPVTVRALAVDDTIVLTADVCGLDDEVCSAVRTQLAPYVVAVHAIHTHSAPASMMRALNQPHDPRWLALLSAELVAVAKEALTAAVPARLAVGSARKVGVAKNRRGHPERVDDVVSVVRFEAAREPVSIATLVSYACHPVVLDAYNLLISADYPFVVRREIEQATSAPALFLTGCAGDANTGHSPHAVGPDPNRTFEVAEQHGRRIAAAALAADLTPVADAPAWGRCTAVECRFEPDVELLDLAGEGESGSAADTDTLPQPSAVPDRGGVPPAGTLPQMAEIWRQWANRMATEPQPAAWHGDVTVFGWGELRVVFLPGEPFAAAAAALRDAWSGPLIAAGYTNGCPGYFPSADEIDAGGYEVCEAHRFYDRPGRFVAGTAEANVAAAISVLPAPATDPPPQDISPNLEGDHPSC